MRKEIAHVLLRKRVPRVGGRGAWGRRRAFFGAGGEHRETEAEFADPRWLETEFLQRRRTKFKYIDIDG